MTKKKETNLDTETTPSSIDEHFTQTSKNTLIGYFYFNKDNTISKIVGQPNGDQYIVAVYNEDGEHIFNEVLASNPIKTNKLFNSVEQLQKYKQKVDEFIVQQQHNLSQNITNTTNNTTGSPYAPKPIPERYQARKVRLPGT